MEYNDPSQRQYTQTPYDSQQQQQQPRRRESEQTPGQYTTPGSTERLRQSSYMQQSPTLVQPATRLGSDAHEFGFIQGTGYGDVSSPPQTMQFASAMQAPGLQRPQDSQNYPSYANVMYGMPETQPQTATQSAYGASQYRYRPSASSETMTPQFGDPQNTQYYLTGQSIQSSTSVPHPSAQQISAQYPSVAYAQHGPSSSQTLGNTMVDPSQSGTSSAYAPSLRSPQTHTTVTQAFSRYQTQIRTIFTRVKEGSLSDLGNLLLEVSHYLLGNAEALGLTRDDPALRDERIRLWDEFNRAWLTALQTQFEMTQRMFRHNLTQPIMNVQVLEHLSRQLVKLCDDVESHGLVDYQMGVAEEEIMDLLIRCLNLLAPTTEQPGNSGRQSRSSGSNPSRKS